MKKYIKGKNCSLKKFQKDDGRLVELIHYIFHEKALEELINPEYLENKTRSKIRGWINSKAECGHEMWYIIVHKNKYIGYVCYKWKPHYDKACEISTAIADKYRGLKLGYESSKLLIDYVKSLGTFDYLCGFAHRKNEKAINNLRKLGLRRSERMFKVLQREFYGDSDPHEDAKKYTLLALKLKK